MVFLNAVTGYKTIRVKGMSLLRAQKIEGASGFLTNCNFSELHAQEIAGAHLHACTKTLILRRKLATTSCPSRTG